MMTKMPVREATAPYVWRFLEARFGVGNDGVELSTREIAPKYNLNNQTISNWHAPARAIALTALEAAGYTHLDLV